MQVKDRVLAALEASRGTYLSGCALAQQLQVSRNAVWKAISQLRESGYPIQAVSTGGYCLMWTVPLLSPRASPYTSPCRGCRWRWRRRCPPPTPSLRQRAEEGAPEGLVLAAVEQTAGKGRQGHSFFSPPDTGLYLSLLLRPKLSAQDALLLTTCAAAAVALAIEACAGVGGPDQMGQRCVLPGKEGVRHPHRGRPGSGVRGLQYAIVGMGVNLFPPAGGFLADLPQAGGGVHRPPPGAGEPQPAGGGRS